MSSFTKPLTTTYVGKGCRKVARGFEYHVGSEGSEEVISIPKGFITDFASVPWPASMFIPKDGDHNQAAVTHDYLYSKIGKLPDKTYTRAECDKIFLEAMGVLGVNKFKRRLMYRAVRIGGGFGWRQHCYRAEMRQHEKKNS